MQRDTQDDPNSDPQDELRRRIANQVSAQPPDAVESPVYADPAPTPPPPDAPSAPGDSGGVTPWSEQNPWSNPAPSPAPPFGVTDPNVRDVSPPSNPNESYQPPPEAPAPAPDGAAGRYPTEGGYASLPTIVAQIYRTALGREASPEEIAAQIRGGSGDLASIQQGIYASPEAQAYNKQRSQAATPASPAGPTGGRPTGGSLTDPSYAARYVAWAGTQPGVNPSVKNDPGYWIGRFTSGAFGNDQDYALMRMMQAEGAPEGAASGVTAPRVAAAAAGARPSISAPTATSFSALSNGSTNGPQGVWNSDFVQQVRAMLMQRLGAASQPVDPNDPSITAPLTAARDEATRTSDKERTALAENLYANGGLNTDAIGQKIQQSGEKNALGLSSLRATLITRELQSKRDELKSLLQMALQSGDAESAQAIQLQLAELSAQVQREGMGVDLAKYQGYLNALGSEQVMN